MKLSNLAAAAVAAALPLVAAGAARAADAAPMTGTVEVGYTRANWDADPVTFGFNTVHLRGSLQANKYWGGELELGFGVGSDNVMGVDVKQETEAGLYIDGYLPAGPNGDFIARVGWSRTVAKVSAGGGSVDGENKGVAAGVGYRYFPGGGANGFRLDYTHYFYDGDTNVNAFSVGYVRRF